jgi:hypothetical protein
VALWFERNEVTMSENNNDQAGSLPKKPHPALATLQPLIGRWRIEGKDVKGEVTYEWMEGGFFFIQRFDLENFGERYTGVEYSGWDDETETIRSRLMGTDGSRFTYTYRVDGNVYQYWFGDKGSSTFARGVISDDGREITGRWNMPGSPSGGYDWHLTRLD